MPASYDYDTSYEPPAPAIPVGLSRSGETSASQEMIALVDTGGDTHKNNMANALSGQRLEMLGLPLILLLPLFPSRPHR